MKTTSAVNAAVPTLATKKKARKGAGNRRVKITNTHLKDLGIDLSKDYVPVPK